ncbi:gamma-aminobutyric acid receptor subunit alpha-2 [Lingula anatina]|uniref:Gamma-aminobutyric acid receptor subunit alpha-2 n=1 Tax=Lingula anatina TaxID=7574 RepID=A0A1S3JMH4_LINAN|nr:gamma-aminobutyric acid receptor subunit alpha-2 [Lingula anatina]|eukprot:XP_013411588.1 gamma-aminobutyric acid receptor subunit alpha-2 [Lingula anatina]
MSRFLNARSAPVWKRRRHPGYPKGQDMGPGLQYDCRKLFLAIFVIFMSIEAFRCESSSIQSLNTTRNITTLLDYLLHEDRYDRQLRPGFGGPPSIVQTDIHVRSFGPVSELEGAYSMDCYFRQQWYDKRLTFEGEMEKLSLSIHVLKKIWKPDTYFYNGKKSYLHAITVPNKLLRIRKDGLILYSMRLTIKAKCPMLLRKYPLDTQECPLYVGSYGHSTEDLIYQWKYGEGDSVKTEGELKMAQFELAAIHESHMIEDLPQGNTSLLAVKFHLQRNIGYFLLQIYLPCYMLVGTSWIAFWINREGVPARLYLHIEAFRCESSSIQSLNTTRNITTLLDYLLHEDRYDRQLRPGFGGPPSIVQTDIHVRSFGPVSELEGAYSMDCYFRQQWYDKRLTFEGEMEKLSLSIHVLKKIWKPDTYFYNGKKSYLHAITVPNKLLRIRKDGLILYSMRLTIKAKCPMLLRKYPLDTQECPLYVGSYGHSTEDLIYQWKYGEGDSVKTEGELKMAQFELAAIHESHMIEDLPQGNTSLLAVKFHLQRNIGYFLLQIYLPCYMLVGTSWIAFWINREGVPARVQLTVTTVLTTCTIGLTGRDNMPKVEYLTALDTFLLICFIYVFAAAVEFASVNYFTKGAGDGPKPVLSPQPPLSPKTPKKAEDEKEKDETKPLLSKTMWTRLINGTTHVDNTVKDFDGDFREPCWQTFFHCLLGNPVYRNYKQRLRNPTGVNSISRIDRAARVVFPGTFIILNFFYWLIFLYF